MPETSVQLIGVDLGGTNARAAHVDGHQLGEVISAPIPSRGSVEEVLDVLYSIVDRLNPTSVQGIGIGVPSVVDVPRGIVYDVQNIPSWKEVPVKDLFERRYGRPVFVNNDANCFAVGERHFGKGQAYRSFVGMIIGTGCAGGLIFDGKLYSGPNCGAGEFGMMPYLDSNYEMYCAGQFFTRTYGIDGDTFFRRAADGDPDALAAFREYGRHLGEAVKVVLLAYDPEAIIFGGGVRHAYPYFQEAMWENVRTFLYPKSLERLRIEVSDLPNSALLGAAALALDGGAVRSKK